MPKDDSKKSGKNTDNHYLDNAAFLAALIEYREMVKAAKANKEPKPRIPEFIGKCFLDIATHLAYRGNFIGYTYHDEMISDAVDNCLTYVLNFDPEKGKNPFGYFSRISYWAFVRRLKKEETGRYKRLMTIDKLLTDYSDNDEFTSVIANNANELLEANRDFIDKMEKSMDTKRKKRNKKKAPDLLAFFVSYDEVSEDGIDI